MAFQSITTGTYTVHPSANDVASTTGDGSYLKETLITDLLEQVSGGGSWIVSGFDYASASGLTATFNAGTAIINGYLVSRVGTFDVTLEDDVTNHVWLTFSVDGSNNVTAWGLEINSTNTVPTGVPGYVKLATITTVSGAVTASTDERTTTHPLDQSSIATTKGDLLVRSSSELTRLPIGSNNQILTADSAEGNGMKWADSAGGGGAIFVDFDTNSGTVTTNFAYATNISIYFTATGTSAYAVGDFVLPSGFTSIDAATLYMTYVDHTKADPTLQLLCGLRADGEHFDSGGTINSATNSSWYAHSSNDLVETIDVTSLFSGAAAGDLGTFGVSASSMPDWYRVLGLVIEYS